MKKIKIVLADDHQIVMDGLDALLSEEEDIEIIAKVNNGKKAVEAVHLLHPDIVVLDLDMPVMNGIVASQEIKRKYPDTKIIILSLHSERSIIQQLIKIGVHAYLLKNADKEELSAAIHIVANGKKYFSGDVTIALSNEIEINIHPSDAEILSSLTNRETEILKAIAEGLSNKEISENLFLSQRTVDTHRQNIMKKLNVRKVVGLIKFAIKSGLVD